MASAFVVPAYKHARPPDKESDSWAFRQAFCFNVLWSKTFIFCGFISLMSIMNTPSFSSGRKGDRTQGIMDTFGLPSLLQGLLVAICVFLGNYIKVLNLYYLVAVEFRLCSFLFLEYVKIKKI